MILKLILFRLILGLVMLLACGQQGLGEERQSRLVSIECERHLVVSAAEMLRIHCKIANGRGHGQNIYFLADRLALEGPLEEGSPYAYVPSGWERFENVLRYDRSSVKQLDPPSPFHPTVHLTLDQLSKLVVLEGRGAASIDLVWKLPGGRKHPSRGEWHLQVKMVYLTHERLSNLLRRNNLPQTCRARLDAAILSAKPRSKIVLEAVRREDKILWSYDGCRDVISEAFQHLYSNKIVLRVDNSGR